MDPKEDSYTILLMFVALGFFWILKKIFFPVDFLKDTDAIITAIEVLIVGAMYTEMLWHKVSIFLSAARKPKSTNVNKNREPKPHGLTWGWIFIYVVSSVVLLLAALTWLKFIAKI